jgi:hypothetical protein
MTQIKVQGYTVRLEKRGDLYPLKISKFIFNKRFSFTEEQVRDLDSLLLTGGGQIETPQGRLSVMLAGDGLSLAIGNKSITITAAEVEALRTLLAEVLKS